MILKNQNSLMFIGSKEAEQQGGPGVLGSAALQQELACDPASTFSGVAARGRGLWGAEGGEIERHAASG